MREATGQTIRGWLAPALTHTVRTLDLIAEYGLDYTCDLYHDDQPQRVRTASGDLISMPYSLEVNDHYGHTQGDLVLQWTANKLCATLRESDLIIRWGGDEFLVVAYQRQMEPVTVLPERILAAIRQQEDAGALPFRYPTCSLGFTRFPLGSGPDRDVWLDALKLADAALLMAKQRGRNRAVGVTERGRFSATELDSIAGLETAAAAGEIEIVHII